MLNPAQKIRLHRLRWAAFSLVALAYILSFFHRFAPAAISVDLQQTFQASGTELGALAATYFYVYAVMQIPTGVLVDTLGPRRILAIGGLVAGAGAILFGLADSLAVASIGRLLVGLGVSVTFISLLKLNAAWFHDRHFATLTGLSILLGNIGALLAASPLAWALGFVSWRSIFVAVGGLSLGVAVLGWMMVRDHPGKAGLPSMRELDGKVAHPPHEGHWYDGLVIVAKNRATWPGFWVNLGMSGSFFAFGGLWAVPFLHDVYDMERGTATAHTSMLLLGFAVGAFFVGTLSDRLGRRKPVIIAGALLYCLSWLPLLFGWRFSPMLGYVLFLVMGLGASGFTLTWACAKEVNRHALSGMATSVVNTGAFLGTGILQPLTGWMVDQATQARDGVATLHLLSDYQAGLGAMLGFALMGLAATLFIRETYCHYVDRN
ncbi:MAG: MFS transporter [Hydrogenophilales bacterium CG_4_9_14_3_um_filter_59_35]|nr:MAG: MFS transporter [Hydrogenophilales bacterium CG18_big_fil_WC_8_21_14_2_50_58_12]PIY01615.1 MAG: MFS transporter [Hydrogenophilales bacterium CG_4_10_14_3_um_filter_58_23]PJB06446.1 MAG: MFS transporter [Hydrogenophilales bacterium CG_4_9_14_3_um_filter_59_35]